MWVLLSGVTSGQQFYRIQADFTIKEKRVSGESQLLVGTVYYDRMINQVIYKFKFPKIESIVLHDTLYYKVVGNKITERQKSQIPSQSSIFNIALLGQLPNFGLKNSLYTVQGAVRSDDMVISTWLPSANMKKYMGKIVMSNKNKDLSGIVFYSPANEIVSKQFFKNYKNIGGLSFPTEITQISYTKTGNNYQVTTYKNIIINGKNDKGLYRFIPTK